MKHIKMFLFCSFMEIVPDMPELFSDQLHFDLTIFKGVIGRTKHCKIKTIDFRGFTLSMYKNTSKFPMMVGNYNADFVQ